MIRNQEIASPRPFAIPGAANGVSYQPLVCSVLDYRERARYRMVAHYQHEMSPPKGVDAQRKKILILEDDEELSFILQQSLEADDFEVVAVQNGSDGIREILTSDFGAIVCDIMMPILAGDMFYLAVERIRPELRSRFIFISGEAGNRRVTEFFKRIHGTLLKKPFHADDLLDLIHFIFIRTALASPD